MNKRIISSLILFPLIASCHGNFVSFEHAKKIYAHLKDTLVDEESESYLKDDEYTLDRVTLISKSHEDGLYTERSLQFDSKSYFYSEYELKKLDNEDNYNITEKRYYLVKDELAFYKCERKDGESSEKDQIPIYHVDRYHYQEEEKMNAAWDEFVKNLTSENRLLSKRAVIDIGFLIELSEAENGIQVSIAFQSMNDNSLYLSASYKDNDEQKTSHKYEISISNYHLETMSHHVSDDKTSFTKIDYSSRVDRLEPDLSKSEPINTIEIQ